MKRKYFIKGAVVLLLVAALVFSSFAVTAQTQKENAIALTSNPTHNTQPPIPSSGRAILWDQYDTDGSNGLSHMDPTTTGTRRDLLDDFEIPEGETWFLEDLHSLNLWYSLQPGVGTDFHLEFWSDAGGVPGASLITAVTVSYTETATGRVWFSRNEFEIEYVYQTITLTAGTYWIYGHVVGPENCFWMAKQDVIWGSECWCDYADQPPMCPGSTIFGDEYDLAFQLTGEKEQPGVPPDPPEIQGPDSGKAGVELCWKFHAYDNDSAMVRYIIDWGDGTTTTTDWSEVCTWVEVCHTYTEKGTYIIKVKAEDDSGLIGGESQIIVEITKTKAVNYQFFQQFLGRLINAFPMLKYLLGF